jgi:hypothetical protein
MGTERLDVYDTDNFRLCGVFEISDLRIECALEGRPHGLNW